MTCTLDVPPEIKVQFSKLLKRDRTLFDRVMKKISEIQEKPTQMGSPKKFNLKGARGVHIGSFVLVWAPIPPVNPEIVKILLFEHHDDAYNESY